MPSPRPFLGQSFDALYQTHKGQKESGRLFIDDKFPSAAASLGPKLTEQYPKVVWKRPHEINPQARLLVDGASVSDVVQGHLGNCWLVTALSVLAGNQELFDQVVPNKEVQDKESVDEKLYAGIVRFRFWRMGKIIEVVIDDTLPVNHETDELIFARPKTSNEFWGPLLEKAYAKLVGSYENLDTGSSADALVDFTNGVVDEIQIDSTVTEPKRLFEKLAHARQAGALLTTSIGETDVPPDQRGKLNDVGLVSGHAYAITAIKRVKHAGFFNFQHFEMIRLRNPWGEGEWNGPFSDKSEEWKKISDDDKKKMGLVRANDGDFWMLFSDFVKNFTRVVLCRVVNTAMLSVHSTFHLFDFYSAWTKLNSGGSINNKDTFLKNPQFVLMLKHKAKLVLSLQQEDHRSEGNATDHANKSIGYVVMNTEENRTLRATEIGDVVHKVDYINSRQLSSTCEIGPGTFVILPTTFEPDQDNSFLLRVFVETSLLEVTSRSVTCEPLVSTVMDPPRCKGPYNYRVTVKVAQAQNLIKQDFLGKGADPYVIVRFSDASEGCCGIVSRKATEVRGLLVVNDTVNPSFDESFVFFGHSLDKALINVQVWNYNTLRPDTFMGEINVIAEQAADGDNMGKTIEFVKDCTSRPLSTFHRSADKVAGSVTLCVRVDKI